MTQEQFDAVKKNFVTRREVFQMHKTRTKKLRDAVLESVAVTKPYQKASKVAYLEFLAAQAVAVSDGLKNTSYPRG